jgi:hypothetical protein
MMVGGLMRFNPGRCGLRRFEPEVGGARDQILRLQFVARWSSDFRLSPSGALPLTRWLASPVCPTTLAI